MMREEKARKEAELAQSRQELEEEQSKSRGLGQQVERLRALVESLDGTKEELVRRL